MKKYSVLVKQVLMSAAAAVVFAFGFTSCSDEIDVMNPADMEQAAEAVKTVSDLMNVSTSATTLPLQVKADGEWRIGYSYDDLGQMCHAYPKHGMGNKTIKLYIQANNSPQQRYNEVYVISTATGDTLQRVPVSQQAAAMTRSGQITVSNRIYGAGYGYNMLTGQMTNAPLVATAIALETGILASSGAMKDVNVREYTGSCFTQLCNDLQCEAKFEGKAGGFDGEVAAQFDMKTFRQANHDYVMTKVDAVVNISHLEAGIQSLQADWLTDEALAALEGKPITKKSKAGDTERIIPSPYTSDAEGFRLLIQDYGTHLLTRCKLGGKLTYATTIDLSKVDEEYDINAYAKCAYKNKQVKASAEAKDNLKITTKTNSSAVSTRLSVIGGSTSAINGLKNSESDASMEAWIASLQKGENTTVVDLSDAGLTPLYDLVQDPDRKAKLKEYMTQGQMQQDFMTSQQQVVAEEMGIIPHITNIDQLFSKDLSGKATLVKDLYVGGTLVARACAEFIPKFSRTERSIVIYPVYDNWAKYNMGYFVGNKAWKPQTVCFLDDGTFVSTPVANTTAGAQNELYLSGSSFFAPSDPAIRQAKESKPLVTVRDAYMKGKTMWADGNEHVHNYPIVKIFNRIWTRLDYNEKVYGDAGWYGPEHIKKFSLQNWRVATTADWENLLTGLKNADIELPALLMCNANGCKDLTGFSIDWNGWVGCEGKVEGKNGDTMLFLTGTRDSKGNYDNIRFVEFDKFGKGSICRGPYKAADVKHKLSVRLVQPMKMKLEVK